eukprot:gnl/TRDRNA2_/TRDRNA2_131364_c0_seq1.p1 gnl/TRDRNA2_/TRDRNA2_131364_c0~~gnl/TRDRNA2_/TRDRNA2_131364_c0_seq1.p1  ORF type:complete len:259 (+),score=92.71 gnl/TRDRNA2_/TRDRNA2_131364_c0_seq1:185-961(+)
MKPDWDKLAEDFKDSPWAGVYDVDCTASGKELCAKNDVEGYPTIKYGEASTINEGKAFEFFGLKTYEGPRDYEELRKFADENLGPVCGVETLDACSEADRLLIDSFIALPLKELAEKHAALSKEYIVKQNKLHKQMRKHREKEEDSINAMKEVESEQEAMDVMPKAKTASDTKKPESKKDAKRKKKKDASNKKRVDKLNAEADEIAKEGERLEQEQKALDAEISHSGLKLMKSVVEHKRKSEMEESSKKKKKKKKEDL